MCVTHRSAIDQHSLSITFRRALGVDRGTRCGALSFYRSLPRGLHESQLMGKAKRKRYLTRHRANPIKRQVREESLRINGVDTTELSTSADGSSNGISLLKKVRQCVCMCFFMNHPLSQTRNSSPIHHPLKENGLVYRLLVW